MDSSLQFARDVLANEDGGRIQHLLLGLRVQRQSLGEALARMPQYVAQLALYRAVLARLYPDKPVQAALLWTDTPMLMEIPAAALDAAIPAILTPA